MENTEKQEFTNETPNPEIINENSETDNSTEQNTTTTDNSAEQAAIWQDKYTRLVAEFDNFRKRTAKEKIELIQNGGENVIKAFLSIADDLERAITVLPEGSEREGMELILKKFLDTLRAQKVTQIEALGLQLDVDFHDAIAQIPAPTPEQIGTILDVVQNGYLMGEKVMRHAKVVVGE